MTLHRASRSSGFSLIEVLVAVVVLSFGLLALAALQGSLFKASAEARMQSVGLGLATEQLEFFRSYKDISEYLGIDNGSDSSTLDGITYARSWEVTRYAYPAAGGTFVTVASNTASDLKTACGGGACATSNEFKRIAVKVAWKDAAGKDQSVQIEDAIAALDPGDSRKLAKLTDGSRSRGPLVQIYDPTKEEGVIPIAIGDDTDTAATNPKPVVNTAGTAAIETRFDVFTYTGADGSTATAQSRVETAVMACSCAYGTNSEQAKRPTYWDGTHYVDPENASYAAPANAATGKGGKALDQSELCSICCRDHHDPSGVAGAKFDPRDTSHSSGHSLLGGSTRTIGGTYAEACRVIRVNGFNRVAADTYNDYSNLLPTWSLQNPIDPTKTPYVPTDNATKDYQEFVRDYLVARDVTPSTNYNSLPAGVPTLEAKHGMARPYTAIQIKPAESKWLHLRGLYIDYLEDSARQAVDDAKTNCSDPSKLDTCVLKVLPFTSINLTELGDWSPLTGAAISVTNGDFSGAMSDPKPIRGKVTANTKVSNGQKEDGVATIRRSNSGQTTLTGAIDGVTTEVWRDSSTLSDRQAFQIYGAGTPTGGSFTVSLRDDASQPFATNPRLGINDAALPSGICNPTGPGEFGCDAAFLPASHTFTVVNYNWHSINTVDAATTPLACNGSSGSINYPGATYSTYTCHIYQVTNVTPTATWVENFTGENAKTDVSPVAQVANGNNIVIQFSAPSEVDASPTCSYDGDGSAINQFTIAAPVCP